MAEERLRSTRTAHDPSGRQAGAAASVLRLHRIGAVRRQQGVSLRSAARQLGRDLATLRLQEQESSDLRLTELYRWQQVLDVPVEDLLVEPNQSLSRPVLQRSQLVRIMKTAQTIKSQAATPQTSRMAQTLVNQLIELMPELAAVTAWHTVGQRRSADELGRTAYQVIPESLLSEAAGFLES